MSLLKHIRELTEGSDMSALPEMVMKDIQSNIRKGAQDVAQKWANALELVHKAYSVSKVQRPSPGMTAAWKQYDENITYSVQQLAKARGMKGDWRMSASSLHEQSLQSTYKVILDIPHTDKIEATVESPDLNGMIDMVKKRIADDPETSQYETKLEDLEDGVQMTFWMHGIRTNGVVKITKA